MPNPSRSRHVGNPIDIVSGNKYQSDVDVRFGGSKLSLVRHYNSVNAATNLGLGNGWRHTYSVLLVADGDDIRTITQSDGRVVEFRKQGSLYQSLNEDDGYVLIQADNRHAWHLPDGRVLSFHGSFLTEIAFADGGVLSLFYRNLRLHSVTDELGRSIVFRYAEGTRRLPAYEPATDQSPAGHLIAVELSDGSAIRYRYDNLQNLVSVAYPNAKQGSDGFRYRYGSDIDSTLLTERHNWQGTILARWGYDSARRVISYRKGLHIRADGSEAGVADLTLSYAAGDVADSGTTVASYRNGARTDFRWRLDENHRVVELSEQHTEAAESQAQLSRSGNALNNEQQEQQEQSAPSYLNDVLEILTLDELGYPNKLHYQVSGESEPHQLDVNYSQVGELLEVDWRSGLIRDVNSERPITRQELSEFVNTHWNAGTQMPDVLSAVAQRGFIETSAKLFLRDSSKALAAGVSISGVELNEAALSSSTGDSSNQPGIRSRAYENSPDSTPCLDPLEDCTVILEARDYAEVSDCAYVESPCNTRFFEANLDELGVDWSNLVKGSFRSGIYYDRDNDEYIVTFAGTDFTSGSDWANNIQQEFGRESYQYKHAVLLARQLTEQNPDLKFKFTGHSLGGGLATAAAAAVDGEAIVFNPAAVTPETAINYSFDYANAESNAEVFSVEGELLSHLQNEVDFANKVPGNIHTLRPPAFSWIQANVGQNPYTAYNTRLAITLHGMDAVNQSLSELVQRYNCE